MNVQELRAALADLPDDALVMGMGTSSLIHSVDKADFEDVPHDGEGNVTAFGSGTVWLRLSEF